MYRQLLYEHGIDVTPPPPSKAATTIMSPRMCCNQEVTDERAGHMICWRCGKVNDHYVYRNDHWMTHPDSQGRRPNCGVTFRKKRPYVTRIHFWTHFKKYIGAQSMPIGGFPEDLLADLRQRFNVAERNVYSKIKEYLKKRRMNHMYKYIWKLIYVLGGRQPQLESETYAKIRQEFVNIQHYFYSVYDRSRRHNIKSVSMLLELLLKQVGHDPYYHFPQLKNTLLRQEAFDFYDDYLAYLVKEQYFQAVEGVS